MRRVNSGSYDFRLEANLSAKKVGLRFNLYFDCFFLRGRLFAPSLKMIKRFLGFERVGSKTKIVDYKVGGASFARIAAGEDGGA